MLARLFRPRGLTGLGALAVAACASTGSSGSSEYASLSRMQPLTSSARVFNAEQIRRTGAITAWDAVRLLIPPHRLQGTRDQSLRTFGFRAGGLDAPLQLILDGQPVLDFEPLISIPAGEVVSLRILSASEAAPYFAGRGGNGALMVQTRFGLRQP